MEIQMLKNFYLMALIDYNREFNTFETKRIWLLNGKGGSYFKAPENFEILSLKKKKK